MKLVLLGATGQLGQAFTNHPDFANFNTLCLTHSELDICDADAVSVCFANVKPDVVINCAAYTAVDAAEQNKQLCLAINTDAVSHIAKLCQQYGTLLIQFSTDYVFDGKKASAYTERDTPNPINHYGKSKWLAEHQIQQHCEKYLILRTSWLFSEYGQNFYRSMLKLAKTGQAIRVITDQIGCPTYAGDVATAVINTIKLYQRNHSLPYGVYHLTGASAVSWYGFAQAIFAAKQIDVALWQISTAEWAAAALRPANSILDNQKIQAAMGVVLPDWHNALAKLAREYT